MAKITWIIFGILVAACSAQFGFNRNERFLNRPQYPPFRQQPVTARPQPNRILQSFGIRPEDKKCFTMARRPFFMTRIVHYPCNRRMPGIPVIRSFMGPMGPVCMSYIREPVYRYYRIPVCCPGFMERAGRCFRVNNNPRMQLQQQQQQQMRRHNNEKMMAMAARMRQAMWHRAQKDMARRRAMLIMSMRNRAQMRDRRPPVPMRRPPMSPMFHMYQMHRNMNRGQQQQPRQQPRIAFLRFNRQSAPPMPHPVQQPPLSGRFVNLIRSRFSPRSPFPFMTRPSLPAPPMYNMMRQQRPRVVPRIIPRIVLSAKATLIPISKLREFQPNTDDTKTQEAPRVEQPQPPYEDLSQRADNFPTIPDNQSQDSMFQADGFQAEFSQDYNQFPAEDGFQGPSGNQLPTDSMMQVDLPQKPVEMPDLIVEQAPANTANQESCIAKLEAAVKACLKENYIDVPDVLSAFEPFNENKSRVLCEAEDAIFKCISDEVNQCSQTDDAQIARDMLLETAQTVKTMCDIREASVLSPQPEGDTVSPSQSSSDTAATVENVDAIPTDVKPAATPEKDITIIEETPSVESFKEAIQHEVHVQEMRMKEYLLPILLGSGIGFIVVVLFVSLVICCCCKRRLKKKMKLAKEYEKPPLKDGIYTIGVPPPTYEVNGIPPMYYEEAKGEKITSGSPSVLTGTDTAEDAGNNTQM